MKKKALFIGGTGTARKLANPHWQYSRDKIACEEFLMEKYRTEGFPVTIIRPSHTYDAWCDRVIAAMEQAKSSLR